MTRLAIALAPVAFLLLWGCGGREATATDDASVDGGAALADGGWRVNKAESSIAFTATQTGNGFTGEFEEFDAAIVFDPDDLEAASIDVSVNLASAKTGDRQRDTALPGGDWFDVKTHPTARFVSDDIDADDEAYIAHGALTIRGAAHNVDLPFTVEIDGDSAKAHGETTLMRSEWGVGQGEFETGKWVGLNVTVTVDIAATR